MQVGTHEGYTLTYLDTPAEVAAARGEFIGAYQTIFAQAPYFERHSPAEADGRYRQLTSTPDNITVVARKDGRLAGFAIAVPLRTQRSVAVQLTGLLPVAHTYYLAELGVLPAHRGQKLGPALVRERLRLMDTELFSHVVLRVSAAKNASYTMYRDMGFDDMGVYMEVRVPRTDGRVSTDRRLFLSRMLSQI